MYDFKYKSNQRDCNDYFNEPQGIEIKYYRQY